MKVQHIFVIGMLWFVGDKIIEAFKSAISQNPYAGLAILLMSILAIIHAKDSIIEIISQLV